MATARAAYFTHNSRFEVVQRDIAPAGPGEVRVVVSYCGICGTDIHIFHGAMAHRLGARRVLGHEASGWIDEIGEGVEGFEIGQKVVVRPLDHCGSCPACAEGHTHVCYNLRLLGIDADGGFSEFWTVPSFTVHALPEGVSLREAALVEPLAVACHDVSRGRVVPGETALVIGGGPIGILVAVAARSAGASVILSEVNENRLAVASRMGIETVNPTETDLENMINERTGGKGAEVVFEVSGSSAGLKATTRTAAVRGRIVMVAIYPEPPEIDMFQYFWRELELIGTRVYEYRDYERAIEMIARGEVNSDMLITDHYDLDRIQDAFEALDSSPTAVKTLIEVAGG